MALHEMLIRGTVSLSLQDEDDAPFPLDFNVYQLGRLFDWP